MARPFKNTSSANKAFGTFNEPQEAGEYIYNKKARATFCVANRCAPSIKVGTESNRLLFNRSNKLNMYPCVNTINNANLNINLITKLDLKDVTVVEDFSGNVVPSTINVTSIPYLSYNIDPSGNLFGNSQCGINNYVKYMVYNSNLL
jgi:hypothetical protein